MIERDSPFEILLKEYSFLIEALGIFSAVAVLFSSDLVSQNTFLQYVSFGSFLMILLLSSLFIRKIVTNIPKFSNFENNEDKSEIKYFKKSISYIPYFITIIALLLIDFGILFYIFYNPISSNLITNIFGMIFLIVLYLAEIWLPINDLLRKRETKKALVAAIVFNLLIICVILSFFWKNDIQTIFVNITFITIIIIGTVAFVYQWRIKRKL